jgi:glyoxylate reductase
MYEIVTTLTLPDEAIDLLAEVGTVHGPLEWRSHLPRASGLISLVTTRVDRELLERAENLRIVANFGVGYDNVDVAACAERGVIVTNTPDVLTGATADLAMALILSTVRALPQAEASLRAGEFRGWGPWDYLGGDIEGAVLGILGMGRIGQAVARRAKAFEMRIQYHSRTRLPEELERELDATWVDRGTLLTTSDIVSLHFPYSAETHHLLDRETLRLMKPGSYLVNTARGPLVDESALVDALRDGRLAGAGLDVYEHEPQVHPGLLELPNVVLLPHVGSATRGTRTAMALLACRNIFSVLSGGPPITRVG